MDHTKQLLTHLEQVFLLPSFRNPGFVVKKLLTPCCFPLLLLTPSLLFLFSLFSGLLLFADFIHRFITSSFLSIASSIRHPLLIATLWFCLLCSSHQAGFHVSGGVPERQRCRERYGVRIRLPQRPEPRRRVRANGLFLFLTKQ